MTIMSKRGSLDNVVTYEHICDTTADMQDIENKYITLGSTCIVISGDTGGMEIYLANSNKEWNPIGAIGSISGDVEAAIEEARVRVFDELKGKLCHDKLSDKFHKLFIEIKDKAEHCNNVATLQNIKIEADALKVRCLNEISAEEARMIAEATPPVEPGDDDNKGNEDTTVVVTPPPAPVKKQRTISIKQINTQTTWQIETAEDVKKYVAELEHKLMNSLEADTIINIEF